MRMPSLTTDVYLITYYINSIFKTNLFGTLVKIQLFRTDLNHFVFQVVPCKTMSSVHCLTEL